MTNNDYISKASLKKRKGWTDKAIMLFLKEPDKKVINMFYKSSAPIKLYSIKRVLNAESKIKFKQFVKINSVRVNACIKSKRKHKFVK